MHSRIGQLKTSTLPGLLSGLLLGITTIGHGPVYHVHWAIFFGFVPLWNYWLKESSAKRIFYSGWVAQFVFTLIAFHWLAYTVNEFSHMGTPFSIGVMLLYCAFANLQFPVAGLLWQKFFRNFSLPLSIVVLAALTAFCERVGTMIFHWNFGYAWLYMQWPGMQVAELFGFKWLCTYSICLNGFFLLAWQKRSWKPAALAIASFLAINLAGAALRARIPEPDGKARILLIQPNIGNREKERLDHDKDFYDVALKRYFEITDRALQISKPDFAIWPENAFPGIIAEPKLVFGSSPKLREYLASRKLNLLTGSYGFTPEGKATNGLFSLNENGEWASPPYEKQVLLPFGEYIPGAETFPILKKWLPDVRDYGKGKGPVILLQKQLLIGAQICYEGLFDFIARDIANKGAQVIVNITNDSWYGSWMEPWQHFYITMAKAIETRRPIIRDTNTGLTAVIYANGEIPEISPIASEWFKEVEVPYLKNPPNTLFLRWGYWFDWIFQAALLIFCLLIRFRWPSTSRDSVK